MSSGSPLGLGLKKWKENMTLTLNGKSGSLDSVIDCRNNSCELNIYAQVCVYNSEKHLYHAIIYSCLTSDMLSRKKRL